MSSEIMFERIQKNLQVLKMKNTLEILPNYLERAVKDDLNIIEVLDHIFARRPGASSSAPMRIRCACPPSP